MNKFDTMFDYEIQKEMFFQSGILDLCIFETKILAEIFKVNWCSSPLCICVGTITTILDNTTCRSRYYNNCRMHTVVQIYIGLLYIGDKIKVWRDAI